MNKSNNDSADEYIGEPAYVSKLTFDEVYADLKKEREWRAGAERLLDNYVTLLFGKDKQINDYIAKIKSLESEVNRIKSIEVTNKHNG